MGLKMDLKLHSFVWLIAAAFLVAPVAHAQQSGTPAAQPPAAQQTPPAATAANQPKPLSPNDQAFVEAAAQDGMLEIALAKQAQTKSSSPEIKNLAAKIIADHTKADHQLQQIAQKEGFKLPDTLNEAGQKELQKFSTLTGTEFDKAYLKFAMNDHQKAINTFENEVKQGTNQSLKTFASNTLPTLKEHLAMAGTANTKFLESQAAKPPWWEFWKKH
ncbi:MAG: DUF4142 domain-containing protein [Syntrophobacteraceae bacterium]